MLSLIIKLVGIHREMKPPVIGKCLEFSLVILGNSCLHFPFFQDVIIFSITLNQFMKPNLCY